MESLNVVINKILNSYVNHHVRLRKSGYFHFSTDLPARIFDDLNDELMDKIARLCEIRIQGTHADGRTRRYFFILM